MTPPRVPASDILHDSLESSAALVQQTRKIIEGQLAAMKQELAKRETPVARKSVILRAVVEIGAELSRQAESIAKLITSKPTPGSETSGPSPSVSDVMAEIVSGKRNGRTGQQ